jgi:hypothetical protein
MRLLLAAAATLLAFMPAASADIVCTSHGGCWQTGKQIVRHGGVYRGLQHTYVSRKDGKTYKRVLRPVAEMVPSPGPQR